MDLSDIVRLDAEEVISILRANNLPTDGLESEQRERLISYSSYGNVIHRATSFVVDTSALQMSSKRANTVRSRDDKNKQSTEDTDQLLKEFSASFEANEYEYTTNDGRKKRLKGFVRGDVLAPSSNNNDNDNKNNKNNNNAMAPPPIFKQSTPSVKQEQPKTQTLANLFEIPSSSSSPPQSMASIAANNNNNNNFGSYFESPSSSTATAESTPSSSARYSTKSASSSKKRSAIDELKEELAQRQQRRDERGLNAREALHEMIKESRESNNNNNVPSSSSSASAAADIVIGLNGLGAGSGPGRSAGFQF